MNNIIKNFDLGNALSELAIKLHRYDEVAKVLTLQKDNLIRQLNAYNNKYGPLVNVSEINQSGNRDNKKEGTVFRACNSEDHLPLPIQKIKMRYLYDKKA